MKATNMQSKLFQAMADPAFYPHAVEVVQQRETHISRVFLTGHFVYKIKKSVDFGFLDFSTLAKRGHFCKQEVKLNRRLTQDIYMGVAAISFDGERFHIDASAEPVEYAVKMRQLPERRTMERLLLVESIAPPEIERLAAILARFHDQARADCHVAVRRYVRAACTENFRQTKPYAGRVLDAGILHRVESATITFLNQRKALFDNRIAAGRIRNGHGDLRTEHVYFTADGKIQILDCIEFNDHLRILDVASDMAFLAMDLDFRGKPDLARCLLTSYSRHAGDFCLLSLIDFYKSYRAMVRCKVNCIQLKAGGLTQEQQDRLAVDARRYLDLAHGYAKRYVRPVLWVFCGLPASGKSALSSRLAARLGIQSFNSDRVRKQLFGIDPHQSVDGPVDKGIYAPETTVRVYDRLLLLARKALKIRDSVVLDATYGSPERRQQIGELIEEHDAQLFFVECTAPDAALMDRLREREQVRYVSDARPQHFESIKGRHKPLTEIHPAQHILVNTIKPPDKCLETVFCRTFLPE